MSNMLTAASLKDAVPVAGPARDPDGAAFDRMVFRGVMAVTLAECAETGASLARHVGLGGTALRALVALHGPDPLPLKPEDYVTADESEEQAWVRDLLRRNLSTARESSRWLAAIIARRALEGGHLWEDLGLPDRPTLRLVMERHYAPLAARNRNMRWKRFFYRCLCEEEGMSHCTSPNCCDCPEVAVCFEPDSAEQMMALAKRAPE